MLAPHEARYALERLIEGLEGAERQRVGIDLFDYIDSVGRDIETLDMAHTHAVGQSHLHFADASQKDDELRTLRGVIDQCKGEVAELTDAAIRLCDLLTDRSTTADVADALAALRKAMKGQRAREYAVMLRDSVRKFEALTIMRRMLRKLRVTDDVREAADKWAGKQLRL